MSSSSIAPLTKKLEEIYDNEEEEEELDEKSENNLPPHIQKAIDEGIDDVFGKN